MAEEEQAASAENTGKEKQNNEWLDQVTSRLVFCTLTVSMLNCSMCTYNTSVLNIPFKTVRRRFNQTFCARGDCVAADWDFLPLTTSIYVASGMVGSFVAGSMANQYGRMRSMWLDQPVVVAGAVLSGCAYWVPELLHVGRVFLGFGCAVSYCLATMYLAEISPCKIRGVVGCCCQLGVVIGVIVAQLLGLPQLLGTESAWPVLLAVPAAPALLSVVLLRWCPESPRFTFMSRRNEAEARGALRLLRNGDAQVDADLDEYRLEAAKIGSMKQCSVAQLFTKREFRMPLALSLGISLTQQFSGISGIFAYSSSIFETAGVSETHRPFAVLATGLVNLTVTVVSLFLIEKCGRRPMLIWPTCLMAVASFTIVFAIRFQGQVDWLSYVAVGCVIVFIVGYTPGLGPITGLLPTELFRQEARSAATALAQSVLWAACLLVHVTFKPLMHRIGELIFLVFLLLLVPSVVFFHVYMPETKNRTFDEIQCDMHRRRRNSWLRKTQIPMQTQQGKDLITSC